MAKLIPIVVAAAALILGLFYFINRQAQSTKPTLPSKTYKIGIILTASSLKAGVEGLESEMSQLGYKEGTNITYLSTNIDSNPDRAIQTVKDDLSQSVDLFVTIGNLAAKNTASTVGSKNTPIVFIASDPLSLKIIQSTQNPGGNATGIDTAQSQTAGKRLALLKEIAPKVSRVLIFYNNASSTGLDELRTTAKSLNISLVEKKVVNVDDLDAQLKNLNISSFDAIYRTADSMISPRFEQLIAISLKNKYPYSGTIVTDVEKGGLMSYGANFTDIGKQSAHLVDKILKGGSPSSIPVEQPKEPEFTVNLTTASLMGLNIPDNILRRVNRIIR
ncbi:ABC transporter substrate-binding protein [Candidatus Daviesbacteria bacterium]|nr:ABC transporter substrate-binding protein [Candidatus Daviesbacteria bacterium]